MSTFNLPPEVFNSLSKDGQRRYLNSLSHQDLKDDVDIFSIQQEDPTEELIEESNEQSFENLIYDVSARSTSNWSNAINTYALPLLPLSTENSSATHTPPCACVLPSNTRAFPELKTDNVSNDSQSDSDNTQTLRADTLKLEYYNTASNNSCYSLENDTFPDTYESQHTNNQSRKSCSDLRSLAFSADALNKTKYRKTDYTEQEMENMMLGYKYVMGILKDNTVTKQSEMIADIPEQSYERITYEYYTEQEMKAMHSLEVSQHIINVLMDNTMRNVCIPKSENNIQIRITNELKVETVEIDTKPKKKTKKSRTPKKKKKCQNVKPFRLSEEETHLFVCTDSGLETSNEQKTDELREIDTEVREIDPFAVYKYFPQNPKESIQVQRLSYLLSQYQSFTNEDKNQCIYKFICDGNITESNSNNGYKYDEICLLNDWYYTLVHYCDNNNGLFADLYEYMSSAVGMKCDFEKCKSVQRNYQQNISSHDDKHYFGFDDYKQQIRIRLLDNIHSHIFHSYDVGFKLTKADQNYVSFGDGHEHSVCSSETHLLDLEMVRLKTKLIPKKRNLKKLIGLKRLKYNKFVTQMFEENHTRKCSMLNVPTVNSESRRPTKIEINDNYQFGQKFYYWNYHKKAQWQWYIRPKWKDLKSEMIGDKLLEIEEWNLYCTEAKHMSETFLSKSYAPKIERFFGTYFYGIRDGDTLSIAQIMSVLLFSNDYSLQLILNKSYTKRSFKESDQALRQRHSYYANWARLLCETVEIFVNTHFYTRVDSFYHATNCCLYFNEIYSSLYSPTSMTKSLEVSACHSHEEGLLLHFLNGPNNRYFECNWVSPWSNESEILFVGSAAPLQFKTVINMDLSHNYSHYISAITLFKEMLSGNPPIESDENESGKYEISQPIKDAMIDLIDHQSKKEKNAQFSGVYSMIGRFSKVHIADYVYEAFNHFVKNASYHIQFDLYQMNHDYRHVQPFFFSKAKNWIKVAHLCKLFVNIKYLSILALHGTDTSYAIKLTRDRMQSLFNILKSFNKSDSNNKLERISIGALNCESLRLKTVLSDFKPMFASIGWKLSCFGWKKYDTSNPQLIIVKTETKNTS